MRDRHITYRVAVALLIIDDFTDKIISGAALQVRATGLPDKPIRKNDGHFVFTEGNNVITQIEIESPIYHKAVVKLEPGGLEPGRPVLKVRLQPNRHYAAPGGATYLEGLAPPAGEIRVIPETRQHLFRLLYDYDQTGADQGREIHLYHAAKKDLAGKQLAIFAKARPEPELFQVLETSDREKGICQLAGALNHTYQKAGTTIYPVYATKAGPTGEYFLYLPGLEGKEPCPCRVQYAAAGAGAGQTRQVELNPGQGNRLDFT